MPTIPSPVVPVRPAVPWRSYLNTRLMQMILFWRKCLFREPFREVKRCIPDTVPDSTLAQTRTTRKCPSVFAGKKLYLGILLVIVVLVTVAIFLYIESECEPENKSKVNEDIEANVLLRGAKFDELLDTDSRKNRIKLVTA